MNNQPSLQSIVLFYLFVMIGQKKKKQVAHLWCGLSMLLCCLWCLANANEDVDVEREQSITPKVERNHIKRDVCSTSIEFFFFFSSDISVSSSPHPLPLHLLSTLLKSTMKFSLKAVAFSALLASAAVAAPVDIEKRDANSDRIAACFVGYVDDLLVSMAKYFTQYLWILT